MESAQAMAIQAETSAKALASKIQAKCQAEVHAASTKLAAVEADYLAAINVAIDDYDKAVGAIKGQVGADYDAIVKRAIDTKAQAIADAQAAKKDATDAIQKAKEEAIAEATKMEDKTTATYNAIFAKLGLIKQEAVEKLNKDAADIKSHQQAVMAQVKNEEAAAAAVFKEAIAHSKAEYNQELSKIKAEYNKMYAEAKTKTGANKTKAIALANEYKANADADAAALEKASKDAAEQAKAFAERKVALLKEYVNKGGEDPPAPASTPSQ
jgi:hypothetical protein